MSFKRVDQSDFDSKPVKEVVEQQFNNDVELLKASTKKRDLHMMKDDEKLFTAKGHKEKGLRAYAEKDWKAARREFAEAIHYCDAASYNRRDDKTMPADVADVWLSSHLNASQCALNAKDWPAANAYATR